MGALPRVSTCMHTSPLKVIFRCVFLTRLSPSGVTQMYTSIQGQADRKTLASTWCGHCRERVVSHTPDFQTRSGLIQITALLLERNQALGRGKGLQLRLSGRSTATAAHLGLQPVPDTVVRLFGRWFYLMLFSVQPRCTALWKSSSIRALEADQPATASGVLQHQCRDAWLLPHAALALQPTSLLTDSGSTKPITDQPAPRLL